MSILVLYYQTASPYKFTESVYSSLFETHGEDEFTLMNKLHEQTKVVIPENLRDLDKKEIRHKDVINKEDMKKIHLRETRLFSFEKRSSNPTNSRPLSNFSSLKVV